jgi:sn-glycerol 3-phosphate transport system substrate-binding protein
MWASLKSCVVIAMALLGTLPAHAQTTIEFWHAMSGALGERVDELADKFNKSQGEYVLRPVANTNRR